MTRKLPSLLAPWLVLIACNLSAQQLTARDAFWSASDMISVTPNPAAHRHTAAHARAQHPIAAPAPPQETEAAAQHTPGLVHAVELVSENGYGAAPHLVQDAGNRLGLRCSLLLRGMDGRYIEVAPGAAFHSGDHIRLGLLANSPGYIYVIQQGSSGAWSPIFPPPGSAQDANKIGAGEMQMVPGGMRAFAFDQNPGDEKLYIILSRTPIADIDRAIQGLKGGSAPAASHPAPSHSAPQAEATLIAENKIPDFFVQQLASRDLTLVDEQKVDDSSSSDAGGGEKAIYVVSRAGDGDSSSQVVLSLDLHHE